MAIIGTSRREHSEHSARRTRDDRADAAARDSANELYDRGSDLLLAAQELRRAAPQPESAVAIAATLGCIEAALDALAHATAAMRRETDRRFSQFEPETAAACNAARENTRQAFTDFVGALQDANRSARELRERTGPALARLTVGSP